MMGWRHGMLCSELFVHIQFQPDSFDRIYQFCWWASFSLYHTPPLPSHKMAHTHIASRHYQCIMYAVPKRYMVYASTFSFLLCKTGTTTWHHTSFDILAASVCMYAYIVFSFYHVIVKYAQLTSYLYASPSTFTVFSRTTLKYGEGEYREKCTRRFRNGCSHSTWTYFSILLQTNDWLVTLKQLLLQKWER